MRAARLSSLVALFLSGCTAGAVSPSTAPTSSPTPDVSPSPSAAAGFTMTVLPAEEPTAVRMAIPGSKYVFLVAITDATGGSDAATITASATKARVLDIVPVVLKPGVVGEVWVAADPATEELSASVTITAVRGGVSRTVTRTLPVFPMKDERAADAKPHAARWLAWLAAEHPELGITADTEWEPVFVSTLLVVSHYSYWSKDWEMTVAWHNMIAPYDWTDVFLRHRGTDLLPTLAFRIDSVSGGAAPRQVELPTDLIR